MTLVLERLGHAASDRAASPEHASESARAAQAAALLDRLPTYRREADATRRQAEMWCARLEDIDRAARCIPEVLGGPSLWTKQRLDGWRHDASRRLCRLIVDLVFVTAAIDSLPGIADAIADGHVWALGAPEDTRIA